MTENVRKIFDMLGIKPNERFKVDGYKDSIFVIDDNLVGCKVPYNRDFNYYKWLTYILINPERVIKLPKKKKLRDLTKEEWDKWKDKKCIDTKCSECIFCNVTCCNNSDCWINHKYLYSDAFLNREIEVEE